MVLLTERFTGAVDSRPVLLCWSATDSIALIEVRTDQQCVPPSLPPSLSQVEDLLPLLIVPSLACRSFECPLYW